MNLVRRLIIWLWARVTRLVAWSAWQHVPMLESLMGMEGIAAVLAECNGDSAIKLLRAKGASVGNQVRILRGLTLHNVESDMSNLQIGHRCHIGRQVFVDLAAPVKIGDRVTIAMRCTLLTHMDPGDSTSASALRTKVRSGIELGDDVFVGAGATILAGVRVGRGAVIGAGAVVIRDVPSDAIMVGVPAVQTGVSLATNQ
jgi:acetyltransferase-like isoleucine patch superfamily enzyme